MEFSNKLTQLRKQKGFSQETLAEKIGVSRQAISKWENEESYPDLPKLIALSEVLECSIDELCGHTTETKTEVTPTLQKKKTSTYLIIILLIGSFLLGNIASNLSKKELPENIIVNGLEFHSKVYSLDISFMINESSDKYQYEAVFSSNYKETVKTSLVCENGLCKGNVQIAPKYPYYVSLIISNGKDEKIIPLAKNVEFKEHGASWSSLVE